MILTKLFLENFKCFRKLEIDFPALTLLTGENSSGKSTVINSILSLLQSPQFPTELNLNGEWIMMGDFAETVTGHDARKRIGIAAEFRTDDDDPISCRTNFRNDKRSGAPALDKLIFQSRTATIHLKRLQTGDYQGRYSANLAGESGLNGRRFRGIMADFFSAINSLDTETKGRKRKRLDRIAERYRDPKSYNLFRSKTPEMFRRKLYDDSPWISSELDVLRHFRHQFNYISPFRIPPERTYYTKTKADLKLDRFGTNTIEQIASWNTRNSKEFTAIQKTLGMLGLLKGISVDRLEGGRLEIRVMHGASPTTASLADVGFGVSQVLPVLVADQQLGANATLAVSQPEIHLHPSAQALYAEYLVDRLSTAGRRMIVETHSECLINRLRRCVAQGRLKENQVAIYHFNRSRGTSSTCYRIKLKADGSLQGAPKSFFDTYLMDSMALALEGGEQK